MPKCNQLTPLPFKGLNVRCRFHRYLFCLTSTSSYESGDQRKVPVCFDSLCLMVSVTGPLGNLSAGHGHCGRYPTASFVDVGDDGPELMKRKAKHSTEEICIKNTPRSSIINFSLLVDFDITAAEMSISRNSSFDERRQIAADWLHSCLVNPFSAE